MQALFHLALPFLVERDFTYDKRKMRQYDAVSPRTGSWHDRSNKPGKRWPRHNGAPIATAMEHADEQTEPSLDFGLEPGG
jgi:hypothetical protein